jgi:hypothetical protein
VVLGVTHDMAILVVATTRIHEILAYPS